MNRSGSIIVGALAVLLTLAAADLPSAPLATSTTTTDVAPIPGTGLVSMEPTLGPGSVERVQDLCQCSWLEPDCPNHLVCRVVPFSSCGQCVERL